MAAYLVAVCKITNMTDDFKRYAELSAELLEKHGGEYIVRGPSDTMYEGEHLDGRIVVISKWPSMEQLKGFVESEEYKQNISPLREGSGIYDIAAYEGSAPH